MMIGWAILIFMISFNGMVPVADSMIASVGGQVSYQSNTGYNATVIQTNIGCKQNQTATTVVNCQTVTPSSNIFTTLIASFGDWIDALKYLGVFALGVALPYWYLTNDFGLPFGIAAFLNALVWIGYTTVILYFFAFRNPEQ